MHRTLIAALLLSWLSIFPGCQGSGDEVPSAPLSGTVPSSPEAQAIVEMIREVFPAGLETAMYKQFLTGDRHLAAGRTDEAVERVFQMIAFTLRHHDNRRLDEEPGPLINAWLVYFGLDPIAPEDLDDPDAAFMMCVASEECRVITETKFAGVVFRPARFRVRISYRSGGWATIPAPSMTPGSRWAKVRSRSSMTSASLRRPASARESSAASAWWSPPTRSLRRSRWSPDFGSPI